MAEPTEVLRICVLGAESTGTTTLARRLASLYHEPCVDEYAREYTLSNKRQGSADWSLKEIRHIAEEQAHREDAACSRSQKLLICDTDVFTVAVWHEQVIGHRDSTIEQLAESRRGRSEAVALYLLTAPDFPFEHDSIRACEQLRDSMHERFIARLMETARPWVLVTGDIDTRVRTATELIAARFGVDPQG